MSNISDSRQGRALRSSSTLAPPSPVSRQSWTVSSSGKVRVPPTTSRIRELTRPIGMAQSSLPALVSAHAKHLLASPFHNRPGIQLLPHQLIANKQVRTEPF